jgi:gliding motility-associated-like protein
MCIHMKINLHYILILASLLVTSLMATGQPANQNFEGLTNGNIAGSSTTINGVKYSVISPTSNTFQTLNGTVAAFLSVQTPGVYGGGFFSKPSRMLVLNQNADGLNGGAYSSDGWGGGIAVGAADLRIEAADGSEFKLNSMYIDAGYSNYDANYNTMAVSITGYRDGTSVAMATITNFEVNTSIASGQNLASYSIISPGAGGGTVTFTGLNWANIDEIRFTSSVPICIGLDDLNFSAAVAGPTMTTTAVTVFGSDTAVLGGNVTANGGSTVTDRGVVYSSSNNPPLITDNKTSIGSGTGAFSKTITGLTPGTLYYVRAFGTNSSTTSFGPVVTFTTLNNNNNLSNLTLSSGTLSPAFASGTLSYTASVPNATSSINITPTTAHATASVTVNGSSVTSGNAATVPLSVGANTITVQVTAQNGLTKDYTVTVTRAVSSDNNLSNLTLSTGTLNPVFASGTVSYTASVSNATTAVDVTPTVADATASVTVNGSSVTSGNAATVPLSVGANSITIQVKAQDNSTKDYTVTVTREPDAQISAIIRAGSNPSNASSIDYTVTFNKDVTGLNISNFSLTETGGVSGAGIASLSGSGAAYTVSVNTGSGDGSIRLDLADVTGIVPLIGTAMPFTGETYTIDKTAPDLDVVSIASDNTNPALAKSGDVLTLTFTSDETIASPVVSISGHAVSAANQGGNNWSAMYTMLNSDAEGVVSFSIAYLDQAGNSGTTVTSTTDVSSVTFDRTAPAVPADLQVASGNGKNTLSWTANAESDLASYKIYGGTSSDPVSLIATVTPPDVSYVHSGLVNGTTYYYRMVSTDITGNASDYTSSVSSVPKAPQTITFVLASPVTYSAPDFDPGASSDNNTIPVTYSSDDEDVVKIIAGKIHIVGVGTATITASQAGNAAFIAAADVTQSLTVQAKDITLALNASPAITRAYNGNTTATLAVGNYTLTGLRSGDDVTVSGTAVYDTKEVGTGKTITVNTFVLAGTHAANYNLTTTSETITGTITKKDITLSLNASPTITKTYDQSTTATLVAGNYTLTGVEAGEDVTVSGTASYDTKSAGTGKTITVNTFVLAGAESGNYNLTTTSETTTGAITKKDITLTLNASPAITKIYNGNETATLAAGNYTLNGIESGDAVTVSGTAVYDTKEVGTGKTITANTFVLAGAESGNYNLTTTSGTTTGTITKKDITLSLNASPAITKTYDQSTTATLVAGNYTLTGVETGDDVTVSGTASYDTKTVGTGKTITVNTFVLAGTESGNYNLTTTSETTTGAITKKDITLSLNASPAITKIYNGNETATLAAGNYTLNGIESGDAVMVSGTASYDTKTVGTGKTITVNTFVLAGTESGNYNLTTTSGTTTGTITKKDITLTLNASPAITKIYNGNETATLAAGNYTLNGIESGDVVTVSGTASYDTKTVGTGKTITANTFVLAGTESGNYNLTTTSGTTTGTITKKDITLTLNASPAITKIYNGNETATLAAGNYTLNGIESGDAVTVSGTASYDTKAVGTGKTITVSTFVLAGTESGNYNLTTTSETTTGAITKKDITLTLNASPAITKIYNGNETATLAAGNYTLNGIESGDAVTVSGTAVYDTKEVGTGKTITVNTFVLAGTHAANYNLTTTSETTTGAITKKDITLSLNASPAITKTYDQSTTATLAAGNYTLNGIESGDAVTVSGTASYDTQTVGTGKTITVNTFVLAGTESGNYNLTTTSATTTGAITKKDISVTLNAVPLITKVYNGSAAATLAAGNYTLNGIETGDAVTVTGTAVYDSRDAGLNKAVTANAFVLAGAESGNYNLTTTSVVTTGDITSKNITASLNASPLITKVYDGNADATLAPANYSLQGVEAGDDVTVSGNAVYTDKTAGTGKAVTVSSLLLAGAEAHNYTLTTATAAITGNITKKDVTLTLNAVPLITKVYDGNRMASLSAANYSLQNVISDDNLLVSGVALYDTKDAGLSKAITVNSFVLSGLDLANYNLTTISATTTGNITAKDITLSLNASPEITKVYDGTVSAALVPANYSLQGVETGDVVTVSGTAVYDNKQVGAGKVITVTAFVLAGAQSDNYTLTTTTADVNGDITTKQITLALNASPVITKVYDGTLSATLAPANYSLQGIETGDAVTVSGVAVYDTRDVGSGKTITAGSFVLAGADLGNYNLNTVTETTTGTITEKPITVTLNASPLITKVYDGNAGATLVTANYSLQGLETGDVVTVSGTAAYDNKRVGTGKMITVNGFALAGVQSSNYTLSTTTANVNGDITTKPITLSLNASPAITKEYDGSMEAMLVSANYSLQGIEAGDVVSVSGTGHYDDKNGGTGKTVTANDFILAGSDRNNYNLITGSATTTGTITARALTVKADDKEKFVGAVNPVFTLSYSGFINGEDESALTVIPVGATVATQSSPIGTYPITVSGGVSPNYNMTYVPGTLTVKPGAPDQVLLTPADLYENEAPAALAGTLSATSQDPNAVFTYTLVSGLGDADNALFSIQNTNELRTTAVLDFEQKQSYSVRIRATTQNNLSLDEAFMVILRDINEVPTMDVISAQEFCYSEEEESILLTGITGGEEASQAVSLRVRTDNPGLFSSLTVSPVSGNTAILRYRLKDASSIGSAMITVTAQDNGGTANGGIDTIAHSFGLDIYALPVAKIVSEQGTELSKGVTATLVASGGVAYEWSTGDTTASIKVRPTLATTYSVVVISEQGCTSMETITLNVLEDYKAVEGTNLMSPNGDGVNDYWVIDNIDMYPNNVVKVFDRAGREIFSQRDYTNTWDATIGGSALAEGTYFYIVDFGTGADVIKGFITIIRNK